VRYYPFSCWARNRCARLISRPFTAAIATKGGGGRRPMPLSQWSCAGRRSMPQPALTQIGSADRVSFYQSASRHSAVLQWR